MEKSTGLFLIMSSDNFRYCVYRVCEPSDGDEDVVYPLDEPIMKLHNKSCPDGMSFAMVGTKIYMVGGYYARSRNQPFRLSKETIIFDTVSNTRSSGPPLLSPKADPFLFTVASKLFALSCNIYTNDPSNPFVGPKPRFEVLDTDKLESGWRALPVPRLYVTEQHNMYPVVACVVLSNGIFISVQDAGTYAFDLDKEVWNYVSQDSLPFLDQAVPMPSNLSGLTSSLCFAASTRGFGHSAFQIHYEMEGGVEKFLFKVNEIEFDSSLLDLSTPLPPPELYYGWPLIASDNGSLIYLIDSGVDNADAHDTNDGNRYVKVQVCDVKFSKWRLLRGLGKKKVKKVKPDSNIGPFLEKKCTTGKRKGEVGGDEQKGKAQVENSGKFAKSFEKKNLKRSSSYSPQRCPLQQCTSSEPKFSKSFEKKNLTKICPLQQCTSSDPKFSKSFEKKNLKRDSSYSPKRCPLQQCTISEPKREFDGDEEKVDSEKLLKVGRSMVKRRNKGEKEHDSIYSPKRCPLQQCTRSESKREFDGDGEKVDSEKLLKVGRSMVKRRNKGEKHETLKVKLNPIWRRSFFGGPMDAIGEHVYAAFAIKS